MYLDESFPADDRSITGSTRDPALPPPVPPLCKCGKACAQRTVSKHSLNTGRRFWCCRAGSGGGSGGGGGGSSSSGGGGPEPQRCNFFKWAASDEFFDEKDPWHVKRRLRWSRPPSWPAVPCVVASGGFRADDVRQGGLGDCWLLSAISVLAQRPDLISRLFVSTDSRAATGGPYQVRLFIDGRWRVYALDDRFPCLVVEEGGNRSSSSSSSAGKRSSSEGGGDGGEEAGEENVVDGWGEEPEDAEAADRDARRAEVASAEGQVAPAPDKTPDKAATEPDPSQGKGKVRVVRVPRTRRVKINQNPDFMLAYCKAARNMLWVPLLEKAMAKAHGSYAAISGGWIAEAMFDLTGRATASLTVGAESADMLFARLASFHDLGFPMGASCVQPSQGSGLFGRHAYGVLEVRSCNLPASRQATVGEMFARQREKADDDVLLVAPGKDKAGKAQRLIRLRNPHAHGEWRGPFSRKAPEWTPALRKELGQVDEDNGTFWMPFESFCLEFSGGSVDVCKAPARSAEWRCHCERGRIAPSRWWAERALELRTGAEATQCHFSFCQATLRGKHAGGFQHCDVSALVLLLSPDGSQPPEVVHLSLPGQCKTAHAELVLRPHAHYAVLPFSLGRAQPGANPATALEAAFSVLLCAARPISVRTSALESPQLIVHGLHAAALGLGSAGLVVGGAFRTVPLQGVLLDGTYPKTVPVGQLDPARDSPFAVIAVESPCAILVVGVNASPGLYATCELVVSGPSELASNVDKKSLTVPVHVLPPRSVQVICCFSLLGFQDYEVRYGNMPAGEGQGGAFHVSPATLLQVAEPPRNVLPPGPLSISRPNPLT